MNPFLQDGFAEYKSSVPPGKRFLVSLIATAGLLLSGCSHVQQAQAPPGNTTVPSIASVAGGPETSGISQDRLNRLTLSDVVDIALQNNPTTHAAWAYARAASAKHDSARGAYWPTVDLNGTAQKSKTPQTGTQTTYGPGATLTWLLLDMGERGANIESTKQAYEAAERQHEASIQDVTLAVETAYFRYLATKSLLEAQQASLRAAQTNLVAATERHKSGLATIADVLQAKTVCSQAELALQTTEGDRAITRGTLALSMGLPANIECDIADNSADVPIQPVAEKVESLIGQALKNRPDLAAARATTLAGDAHVREVRGLDRPSLAFGGKAGRSYFQNGSDAQDSYSGVLTLQIPMFSGFSRSHNIEQAEFEAQAGTDRARALEQQVSYQVFCAYIGLQTAAQMVRTAGDMLESAGQSYDAALARYKEGLASVSDLLSAQSLLADARARQIQARWSWFTSLAQLAHDVGTTDAGPGGLFAPVTHSPGDKK